MVIIDSCPSLASSPSSHKASYFPMIQSSLVSSATRLNFSLCLDIYDVILKNIDSPTTVLNCCLLRPDWLQFGLSRLYRNIHLHRPQQLHLLYDALVSKPWLRPLVHFITIDPTYESHILLYMVHASLYSLLPSLHGLSFQHSPGWQDRRRLSRSTDTYSANRLFSRSRIGITYHNRALMALRKCANHVKELHICSFRFQTGADFMNLVSAFPQLEDLRCVGIGARHHHENYADKPSIKLPSNLRRLEVRSTGAIAFLPYDTISTGSQMPGRLVAIPSGEGGVQRRRPYT